jgi:Fe2+ or Zn2+ uptake regulation protein
MQLSCISYLNMFKKTPARVAISKYLAGCKNPVDVEQIINFLRAKDLNTNKVTVYRIMDLFYERGLVDKLDFGEGKFRYEARKNHHHHLICTECGKIQDIKGDFVNKLEKEIYKDKYFKVQRHTLEFFGICKSCQDLLNSSY